MTLATGLSHHPLSRCTTYRHTLPFPDANVSSTQAGKGRPQSEGALRAEIIFRQLPALPRSSTPRARLGKRLEVHQTTTLTHMPARKSKTRVNFLDTGGQARVGSDSKCAGHPPMRGRGVRVKSRHHIGCTAMPTDPPTEFRSCATF